MQMIGTDPYVVHFTWTYGGLSGKRSRAREAMLWWDEPGYYSEGSFVTTDLVVPPMPEGYNTWTTNEVGAQPGATPDGSTLAEWQHLWHGTACLECLRWSARVLKRGGSGPELAGQGLTRPRCRPLPLCLLPPPQDEIMFHLTSLQGQLEQAYVGMAIAAAAGRAAILPKFTCFCERIWHAVVNCRLPDAQTMQFPVTCPADYLFQMDRWAKGGDGTPLPVREWSFLENPRTPAAVSTSVVTIRPSAEVPWPGCANGVGVPGCAQETEEAGTGKVVLIPLGLTDKDLLPILEPYKKYRVWRVNFKGVEKPIQAYAGFKCKSECGGPRRAFSGQCRGAGALLMGWVQVSLPAQHHGGHNLKCL